MKDEFLGETFFAFIPALSHAIQIWPAKQHEPRSEKISNPVF